MKSMDARQSPAAAYRWNGSLENKDVKSQRRQSWDVTLKPRKRARKAIRIDSGGSCSCY